MNILYVHGFKSTGVGSPKVKIINEVFPEATNVFAPNLTHDLGEDLKILNSAFTEGDVHLIIGTSMGGLIGDFIGKWYNVDTVLINPLVDWKRFCDQNLGKDHVNHKTGETFYFDEKNRTLFGLFSNLTSEEKLSAKTYVALGESDTQIDPHLAVKKYEGKKNTTIRWYPDNHRFLEKFKEALIDVKEEFQLGS